MPAPDSAAISGLGVRNIGSATMSGRIAAVAGRQEKDGKVTLIVGSASGGVWKSEDGGTTFKPVFDKQPVKSIGAIALDPTNPKVMWVGTGESWTRNSVSVGNGVYKSTDGGETWTNVGLPATERITRIVVHPKNGNIVYVCAPGALWSDSPDRGLYKTTDGGKTWSLILKGANLSTGCSSVAMDPANPEHLLAGTWDFRRKPYEFRSGGNGPDQPSGSRFAESRDGGTHLDRTSTPRNRKGLPKQSVGTARDQLRAVESEAGLRLYRECPPGFVRVRRRRQQLAGARPQPGHGLAALLFRPDRRRSEEPRSAVQDGLFDDRLR